ncbi:hypothetical protein [Aquamicrobium sp. LC103]|uniref:hypothetical protein n=1 Tax=Aquamicrobium sp. LC103 TaxID=1120658 RepID=UPI00109C5516|nr:hypothetical protein [Aquamicrobium sp. LC103]TKT81433.1 hypothetical protein XW59_006130 [Aquamicrobium sp. LC103]
MNEIVRLFKKPFCKPVPGIGPAVVHGPRREETRTRWKTVLGAEWFQQPELRLGNGDALQGRGILSQQASRRKAIDPVDRRLCSRFLIDPLLGSKREKMVGAAGFEPTTP